MMEDAAKARTSSRRGFLKAGAAVSTLSVIGTSPAGLQAAEPPLGIYKVIYDRDHAAAINFGQDAEAAGHSTHAIGRDVTALWYDDLSHRWRDGPAAIAGLTSVSVAMCLELMAWDAGLRTVFCVDHKPTADGGIRHVMSGPAPVLERAALLDTGASWGIGVSRLMNCCPTAGSPRSKLTLDCAATPGLAHAERLVSWVFSPRLRG